MLTINGPIEEIEKIFYKAMNEIPDGDIGVAVSGGGDSVALLSLSAEWASIKQRRIIAATVDHGLRSNSVLECKAVKKIATSFGVNHSTLKWLESPKGNVQNSARNARHRLLKSWAMKNNLSVVLLGHTLDDNAETLMLRLIRGTGIDGLSGIAEKKSIYGLRMYRPMLNLTRGQLRSYLNSKGISWIEDPSNFDQRFDRIKIRTLLSKVHSSGLTSKKLVSVARHISRAKNALNDNVLKVAVSKIKQKAWGDIEIFYNDFLNCSEEVQLRLLAAIFRWNSGKNYNPRFKSLANLREAIVNYEIRIKRPLMGSMVSINDNKIIFRRELSAIAKPILVREQRFIWDNKWQIEVKPEKINLASVGPLGKESVLETKNLPQHGVPRSVMPGMPAMFENNKLICVPMINYGEHFTSQLIGGEESFINFLSKC